MGQKYSYENAMKTQLSDAVDRGQDIYIHIHIHIHTHIVLVNCNGKLCKRMFQSNNRTESNMCVCIHVCLISFTLIPL